MCGLVGEMGKKQVNRQFFHCNKREKGKGGHRGMYRCKFCDGKMSGFLSDTLIFLMTYVGKVCKESGCKRGAREVPGKKNSDELITSELSVLEKHSRIPRQY